MELRSGRLFAQGIDLRVITSLVPLQLHTLEVNQYKYVSAAALGVTADHAYA